MKKESRKNSFGSKGQALVEFAIILLPLVLLVFGMIEFGRYLYLKNSVTNAAREGARLAAVTNPWNNGSAQVVSDYILTFPSMNDGTTSVTVSPSASPPTTGTAMTVEVRQHFTTGFSALIPQFSNLSTIRALATMRYE